ncbi:hypothetical protein D3C80_1167970 [compost metagenome]
MKAHGVGRGGGIRQVEGDGFVGQHVGAAKVQGVLAGQQFQFLGQAHHVGRVVLHPQLFAVDAPGQAFPGFAVARQALGVKDHRQVLAHAEVDPHSPGVTRRGFADAFEDHPAQALGLQRLVTHVVEDHLLLFACLHPGHRGLHHQQVVGVFTRVFDKYRQQGGMGVGVGDHEVAAVGAGFFNDHHRSPGHHTVGVCLYQR